MTWKQDMPLEPRTEYLAEPTCSLCKKYGLHQRANAEMHTCPGCEEIVCEDCTDEVAEYGEGVAPDTTGLFRGYSYWCLDCLPN